MTLNPAFRFLERHRDPVLIVACALTLMIAYADFTMDSRVQFHLLYFIPLGAVSWYLARRWSVTFAIVTAMLAWIRVHTETTASQVELTGDLLIMAGTFVAAAITVSTLARTLRQLAHAARFDALTGVLSTRFFHRAFEVEFERDRRYGRPLTVAFLDVDGFKEVNDSLGHHTGDAALTSIAGLVADSIRGQDMVGRLGGDEFGLLLPETDPASAQILLDRIADQVATLARREGWDITVSIGATCFDGSPAGTCTTKDLLRHADALMYQVKQSGKNRVLVDRFPTQECSM